LLGETLEEQTANHLMKEVEEVPLKRTLKNKFEGIGRRNLKNNLKKELEEGT
jgi:hypothetical protein